MGRKSFLLEISLFVQKEMKMVVIYFFLIPPQGMGLKRTLPFETIFFTYKYVKKPLRANGNG